MANIKKSGWNHIKMVISEKQMLVYVNDLNQIKSLEINIPAGDRTLRNIRFQKHI